MQRLVRRSFVGYGHATISTGLHIHGGYRKQALLAQLGVLSLSERWDSLLMWSHYADSHRGFAIGLSTSHGFFAKRDPRNILVPAVGPMGQECYQYNRVPPLSKVFYTDQRANLQRRTIVDVILTTGKEIYDYASFLLKGTDWSYEREWRLFRRLLNECDGDRLSVQRKGKKVGFFCHDQGSVDADGSPVKLFEIPAECLVEVILGVNMSLSMKTRIAAALATDPKLKHVTLKVARTSRQGYAMEALIVRADALAAVTAHEGLEERLRCDVREALAVLPLSDLEQIRAMTERETFTHRISPEVLKSALDEAIAEKTPRAGDA